MFGHHHELAQAKVLDAEEVFSNWESEGEVKVELVLEVYPPNGQPFRAKTAHHFVWAYPKPKVGDMVNVKYDPKSLWVELVLHGDERYGSKGEKHQEQAQRQAKQDRENALLSAPPGTPVGHAKSAYNANLDPELQELMELEEEERQERLAGGQGRAGQGDVDAEVLALMDEEAAHQARHHGGQGNAGAALDPELQELMALEEAERQARYGGGQHHHGQGAQAPGGYPGTAAPSHPHGAQALEQQRMLRQQLEYSGISGQAKLLRHQQAGEPFQHFAPFFVEVLVQPDNMGYPFQCSFTAWIDTSKGMLTDGYTLPVKYDPQNTARIVFLLPL